MVSRLIVVLLVLWWQTAALIVVAVEILQGCHTRRPTATA